MIYNQTFEYMILAKEASDGSGSNEWSNGSGSNGWSDQGASKRSGSNGMSG